MKFLADEGVDKSLVIEIRKSGFEVEYVAETLFGSIDKDLLNHAYKNNQVILTKDKDFGELVFKDQLKTKGIILIRLENLTSTQRKELCMNWFKRLDWDFSMKYTTISQSHTRVIELT